MKAKQWHTHTHVFPRLWKRDCCDLYSRDGDPFYIISTKTDFNFITQNTPAPAPLELTARLLCSAICRSLNQWYCSACTSKKAYIINTWVRLPPMTGCIIQSDLAYRKTSSSKYFVIVQKAMQIKFYTACARPGLLLWVKFWENVSHCL